MLKNNLPKLNVQIYFLDSLNDLQLPYSPLSNPDDIEIPNNMDDLKVPFPCSPLDPLNPSPLAYSPLSSHGDLEVPMDIDDEKNLEVANNSDSNKGKPETKVNQNSDSTKGLIIRLISSIVSMNKEHQKSIKGKPQRNQNPDSNMGEVEANQISNSKKGQPEANQNQIVQGGNYA